MGEHIMSDTRPNGKVIWMTTITDEYEATFTPEQMEELGFAFINGKWSTEGPDGYKVADTLAEAENEYGSLVLCERAVTDVENTNDAPDDDGGDD
jgi:hypothetical protein